ncbi:stage II sporulation protein M [Chloroflexota bacterium]
MRYKLWILIAVGLFVIGLAAGLIINATMPASSVGFISEELSGLEELSALLAPFQVTTAIFIYFKNTSAVLLSFIFSPILCLLPILTLTLNGTLISYISVIVIQEESIWYLLAGLLPHGIFEIPALLIGEAAALSFGASTIMAIFSKKKKTAWLPNLKQNLKYMLIAFALLIPAAIIETFITPLFLK